MCMQLYCLGPESLSSQIVCFRLQQQCAANLRSRFNIYIYICFNHSLRSLLPYLSTDAADLQCVWNCSFKLAEIVPVFGSIKQKIFDRRN